VAYIEKRMKGGVSLGHCRRLDDFIPHCFESSLAVITIPGRVMPHFMFSMDTESQMYLAEYYKLISLDQQRRHITRSYGLHSKII